MMESRRSIFIEELSSSQLQERWQIDYLDRLEFADPAIKRWVEQACQKRLRKKELDQINRWTSSLCASALQERKFPRLHLEWINPLLGYGVFASRTIGALTLVGEYTGVVRKRKRFRDGANSYIFGYVVGPKSTRYVIDAEKQGNISRFINHSDNPNLTSRWVITEGVCHIIFVANRPILKGEQLTYDYGPLYWQRRTAPLTL